MARRLTSSWTSGLFHPLTGAADRGFSEPRAVQLDRPRENAPEVTAWLAITVAAVASATTGRGPSGEEQEERIGSGTWVHDPSESAAEKLAEERSELTLLMLR